MPTVVNGIGTWYYGKGRIHRHKDVCSFCNGVGDLESYDTTLFFVVFFVPLLPLSRKRILEECPSCRQHRVISLAKWEEIKAQDTARMLERLQQDPDDRDTVRSALGLAVAYQDAKLFDQLAAALAEHRRDDPAIQAQLGAGYVYFVRYPEAEAAFRASLAAADNPEIRERLALVLLKQSRPEEARPLLQHILDQRLQSEAGMIYLLIEGYQAQGMHAEALALMDERDAAFPDLAALKDYQKQRKTSQRYLHSGKQVRSAYLSESGAAGYREGNWTARLPKLIAPLLVLALLALYLGSAAWIGRSRKVYLVNGWDRPYTVAVNGREQALAPGRATDLRVPEGEVVIEFRDAAVPLEPVRCRVETPFFSRPFKGWTFVVNPDQLAVVVREESVYAEVPQPNPPPEFHVGQVLHTFEGIDYEFAPFPQSLKAKKGSTLRKSRVGLEADLSAEDRLQFVVQALGEKEQREYARRWLRLAPDDAYSLALLLSRSGDDEAIEFLRPGLAARPLRVEWHRAYQDLAERADPAKDLRPEYERLAAELKGNADALYLLGRVRKTEEADRLFRASAEAATPSAHGTHALAFDALARGQFADAVSWAEKAVRLAPANGFMRQTYHSALLAAGRYDPLLEELGRQARAGPNMSVWIEQVRVQAAKGDPMQARTAIGQALQAFGPGGDAQVREMTRQMLELVLCCATNDATGFLNLAQQVPDFPHFEPALLKGKLQDAADAVDRKAMDRALVQHGLVYLAARKAKDEALAEAQWQQLMATLPKAGRHERRLADLLAGREPLSTETVCRLPIDPKEKRVLLAAVARRHPEHADALLPLARSLDFQRDATSLCLRRALE